MAGDREASRPDRRRLLGWVLAVGAVLVVLVELVNLVRALAGDADPLETGALWTILLMILVTFGTVGAIGWGLYRAIRQTSREGGERTGDDEADR